MLSYPSLLILGESDMTKHADEEIVTTLTDTLSNEALFDELNARHPDTNHRIFRLGTNNNEVRFRIDKPTNTRSWKTNIFRFLGTIGFALTGFGIPYLFGKSFTVRQGELALTWNNGEPEIYGPGLHYLVSPLHNYHSSVPINQKIINLGPIKIITVNEGEIGVSRNNGRLEILRPGRHVLESATHIFEEFKSLNQKHIQIGQKTIVTAEQGEVGITFLNGALQLVREGARKVLHQASHVFKGFLSVKQETKTLDEIKVSTADNVELKIKADVIYRITNPELAITKANDIHRNVRERAEGVLSNVFRHHNFSEIATVTLKRDGDGETVYQSGGKKRPHRKRGDLVIGDQIHTEEENELVDQLKNEFLKDLSHNLQEVGVEVSNMLITNLEFVDTKLQAEMAKRAVITATVDGQRDAARAKADVIRLEQDGTNDATISAARADAESIKIKAAARAEAMRTLTEAKLALGEMLSQSPEAVELERLRIQAEALQGDNQVVWMTSPLSGGGYNSRLFQAAPPAEAPKPVISIPASSVGMATAST